MRNDPINFDKILQTNEVYMQILYPFIQGAWKSIDFGILGVLKPFSYGYLKTTVVNIPEGLRKYMVQSQTNLWFPL